MTPNPYYELLQAAKSIVSPAGDAAEILNKLFDLTNSNDGLATELQVRIRYLREAIKSVEEAGK